MVIDAGTKTSRNILGAAVISVAALTMVMNAMYGYKLGRDLEEKIAFAAAGVAFDIIKILAVFWVVQAFMKKNWIKGLVGSAIFIGTVAYSLSTATGFALNLRASSMHDTEKKLETIKLLQRDFNRFDEEYGRLAKELEAMQTNVRYLSTASCSVPQEKMTNESKIFCTAYFRQYTKTEEAKKLVGPAKEALDKAMTDNPHLVVDPLMKFLSAKSGWTVEDVMAAWAIAFAFLLEGVASFGLYAFSATRMKPTVGVVQTSETTETKVVYNKDGSVRKKPGRKPKMKIVVDNSKVA